MQVRNGFGHNLENSASFPFREVLLPENTVKKLTAFHQVCYDVDFVLVIVNLRVGSLHTLNVF